MAKAECLKNGVLTQSGALLKQGTDVWNPWRTDHSPDYTPEMPRRDPHVKRGVVVPLLLAMGRWARGAQRVRDAESEVEI